MRLACVYLPSFPLQVVARHQPHLAGAAVVVTHASRVVAASRIAHEAGVRPGMEIARARSLCPDVVTVAHRCDADRNALRALADALLQCSPAIDLGSEATAPHKAVFVEVPSGSRGATFGDKLIAAAARQGLRARVGIADDRFTAWCAAALVRHTGPSATPSATPNTAIDDAQASLFGPRTVTVPRGGAAAFLAPLPLSLLPIDADVRHLLEARGVVTIGDFAALPPPTVGHRFTDAGVDAHELARGDGPRALVRYAPVHSVVERLELESPITEIDPIAFSLRPVVERVCDRLRGRGRAASAVAVRLLGADVNGADAADEATLVVRMPSPTAGSRALLDAIRARIIRRDVAVPPSTEAVEIEVIAEAEPEGEELELLAARPHRRTRRGKRGRRRTRQQALPLTAE